ncbi:hypothetical protein FNV43_RR13037 [Rhamnella rubrinervis]|uniref:Uncharacterized protein n=1 Tax=Rhamnella rubrinervis TaxID=2594499 RepID=A0A8K0H0E8_9ROSA|nr:hypothetical protein FNV43_RR13037 [Rhamnella rubrinervis]
MTGADSCTCGNPVREPSSGSHSVRRSCRGDISSTSREDIRTLNWTRTLLVNSWRVGDRMLLCFCELGAQGFGGPPIVVTGPEEDLVEDTKEDSKDSDDYMFRPQRVIHPDPESGSENAIGRLLEAIGILVA